MLPFKALLVLPDVLKHDVQLKKIGLAIIWDFCSLWNFYHSTGMSYKSVKGD